MISIASATLVISIVKGTLQAGRQIDQLLTLKAVGDSPVPALLPSELDHDVSDDEDALSALRRKLEQVYQDLVVKLGDGDPQLVKLKAAVELTTPLVDQLKWRPLLVQVKFYLPDERFGEIRNSQKDFVSELRKFRPDLAEGEDFLLGAAFMLDLEEGVFKSGEFLKRAVLIVTDQLFEIGAANSDRLLSDPEGRKILTSVLQNLAAEDLQDSKDLSGEIILRNVMAATLNAVVEVSGDIKLRHEWVNILIEGVAIARKDAGDKEGWKKYIGALINGDGYGRLIGSIIEAGSDGVLIEGMKPQFKALAQSLLGNLATAMQDGGDRNLKEFLTREWSGMLRGFVEAVGEHGAEAAKIDDKLAKALLESVTSELVKGWNHGGLPKVGADFFGAVIVSVAKDQSLLEDKIKESWLRDFIGTLAVKLGSGGLSKVTDPGSLGPFVGQLIKTTLGTLASNTELRKLLGDQINETWLKPWVEVIADTLSREDLRSVFSREAFESFAMDLVKASLTAAAENPALLDEAIREDWMKALIEGLALTLSNSAKRDIFTKDGLSKLGVDLAKALADNPRMIAKLDDSGEILALQVVREVLNGVAPASGWKADKIGADILAAVLHGIAARPESLRTQYPAMVGSLASTISKMVAEDWPVDKVGRLAESLATEALLNPKVLLEIYSGVPAWVLGGVKAGIKSAGSANAGLSPLLGLLNEIAASGLQALSKRGKTKLEALKAKHGETLSAAEVELAGDIQALLETALPHMAAKLGNGLSVVEIPALMRDLFLAWAGGPLDDVAILAATEN